MGDYYKEQLVKSDMEKSKKLRGIAIGVLFIFLVLILVKNIFLCGIIIATAGYLENRFLGFVMTAMLGASTEYEYIVTNSFFEIDIITNKSKRKQLYNIDLKDVTYFGKSNSQRFLGLKHSVAKVDNCSNIKNTNIDDKYAIIVANNGVSKGVIFEPNEEIIEIFKVFVPKHAQE